MRIPILLQIAVIAAIRTVNGQPGQVPKTANVHVKLFSASGLDLGNPNIELFKQIAPTYGDLLSGNMAARFKKSVAIGIPTGLYRLRVFVPGFYTAERTVRVYQSDVWILIGLEFGEQSTVAAVVRGRVSGVADETQKTWVKLVGVLSDFSIESNVDAMGDFSMAGAQEGKCLLLVFQGSRVLATRLVDVKSSRTTVNIDLSVAN